MTFFPRDPESTLLLQAMRAFLIPAEQRRPEVFLPVRWSRLLEKAQKNGLSPLLYRYLREDLAMVRFPALEISGLRAQFLRSQSRTLALTAEWFRLLRVFAQERIPVLPWKGPLLALSLYGDPSLREYHDLDFLFSPQDIPKVRELLGQQGYRIYKPVNPAQEDFFWRTTDQLLMSHDPKQVMVELHWAISPVDFGHRLNQVRLWERLVCKEFAGHPVLTLAPEDLLVVLCAHGAKHFWERLIWIGDLGRLILVEGTLDWDKVWSLAQETGCRRMLLLGLFLAHDLLHVPLPRMILQKIAAEPQIHSLALQVYRQSPKKSGLLSWWKRLRFFLGVFDHRWDSLRHYLILIATPNWADWQKASFSRSFFFCYYPLRLLRLLLEYGGECLGRKRKNSLVTKVRQA